ncbi:MAG: DUF2490 domain-containing protein [Akkermansiaceae bacterium]
MKITTFIATTITLLSQVHTVRADDHDSNGNLWMNYVGDHPIQGTKWGIHLEGQARRAEMGDDWQQLLLRPGVNYHLTPDTTLSLGYAYVETHRYGDFPALHDFPEHRFWQQVAHNRKWMGLDWTHRLRLEQRWIGEMEQDSGGDWDVGNWRYENRLRYMLRATLPLTPSKNTYLAMSDEIFMNFGSHVKGNEFDQNRAFIGVGYKFNTTTKLEAGFMEQTLQRRGGKIWEHNHTPVIWLVSTHPF